MSGADTPNRFSRLGEGHHSVASLLSELAVMRRENRLPPCEGGPGRGLRRVRVFFHPLPGDRWSPASPARGEVTGCGERTFPYATGKPYIPRSLAISS